MKKAHARSFEENAPRPRKLAQKGDTIVSFFLMSLLATQAPAVLSERVNARFSVSLPYTAGTHQQRRRRAFEVPVRATLGAWRRAGQDANLRRKRSLAP